MYVVDANVLIEAKNRYYAFDLAPGFWKWLERVNEGGSGMQHRSDFRGDHQRG